MAVYAAQVHRMDHNVGRVVAFLRERGQLDTTLILFLSDNGACAEPYSDLGGGSFAAINRSTARGPGGKAAIGEGGSAYGTGWANASNTPFRRYKSRLHEGGIAAPLIAHWPAGLHTTPGSITSSPAYLTDLMPTALELGGAAYPAAREGTPLTPLAGYSLAPVFTTGTRPEPEAFFWEQYRNKAVRRGAWKAVQTAEAEGADVWELYDLSRNPTELNNLAADHPDHLAALVADWRSWAEIHAVLPRTR